MCANVAAFQKTWGVAMPMKVINPPTILDPEPMSLADLFVEALAEIAAEQYVQARIDELERARQGYRVDGAAIATNRGRKRRQS